MFEWSNTTDSSSLQGVMNPRGPAWSDCRTYGSGFGVSSHPLGAWGSKCVIILGQQMRIVAHNCCVDVEMKKKADSGCVEVA
jgi:hypothetical protein